MSLVFIYAYNVCLRPSLGTFDASEDMFVCEYVIVYVCEYIYIYISLYLYIDIDSKFSQMYGVGESQVVWGFESDCGFCW